MDSVRKAFIPNYQPNRDSAAESADVEQNIDSPQTTQTPARSGSLIKRAFLPHYQAPSGEEESADLPEAAEPSEPSQSTGPARGSFIKRTFLPYYQAPSGEEAAELPSPPEPAATPEPGRRGSLIKRTFLPHYQAPSGEAATEEEEARELPQAPEPAQTVDTPARSGSLIKRAFLPHYQPPSAEEAAYLPQSPEPAQTAETTETPARSGSFIKRAFLPHYQPPPLDDPATAQQESAAYAQEPERVQSAEAPGRSSSRIKRAFLPHYEQRMSQASSDAPQTVDTASSTGEAYYASSSADQPVVRDFDPANYSDSSNQKQYYERGSGQGYMTNGSQGYSSDKEHQAELERIHTFERVGLHAQYYEKGGLRTEGDGVDHYAPQRLNFKTWMALLALAFLWTGSQIPVYLFGGIAYEIYADLGGVDRWIWFVLGNLLALAAVCPFVGALSDLLGRRYVAIIGASLIVIGMIVTSTASDMNNFIGGMTIAGAGAGINELTALAGTAELAPTSKRGIYVAAMVFTIFPWTPAVLWGQLINHDSSWRYVGLLCGVWAFVGLTLTVIFYHPPPRPNGLGYSRREILSRVDYMGGFLSIGGFVLFLAGMQWGGYQYKWTSAHVLVPFFIGFFMLVAWVIWEWKFAKYPMVPKRLGKNPRVLLLTLLITFISGANFFSLLFFWPTQAFNMYGPNYIGVGLRGLPLGLSILFGAVIVLALLGITKGKIRMLMFASSAIMTAGTGAMAVGTPKNLSTMYGLVVVAGIGIGGIVVPASIISTIICPDDLIATITALTLSIRVLGGAIGYTIYYNIFISKVRHNVFNIVGIEALADQLRLLNVTMDTEIATLAANAQFKQLQEYILQTHQTTPWFYNIVITACQWAFAESYKYVYYTSIAFGLIAVIASLFLGDISSYMDDHVAVRMI